MVSGGPPPCRTPRSRIDQPSEEAALHCLRRGEHKQALSILMTAYGALILAYALRILRDRELAKDIRQQVFLEAFQQFDTYQGRGSLWHWLCGITHHRCLDELKRSRRRGYDRQDPDILDDLVGPSALSDSSSRLARQRELERCLGKLPVLLRTQVLLRYFFGLSHGEIGELVGTSPVNVQKGISRILPKLRRCLGMKGAG